MVCYSLFVVRSQADEVLDDLRRGLAPGGTPQLGIPAEAELRALAGVKTPAGWRGSRLQAISMGVTDLGGNILILKVGRLRTGGRGAARLGENGARWSLPKLDTGSETEPCGWTFFSPEIASRDNTRRTLSETSEIPGWTIALYRRAEIGECLGLEDEEVRTPAEAEIETSVSVWHELLLHALPATRGESRYLHQCGDADRSIPARMVVPEARERAIENAIRENAEGRILCAATG